MGSVTHTVTESLVLELSFFLVFVPLAFCVSGHRGTVLSQSASRQNLVQAFWSSPADITLVFRIFNLPSRIPSPSPSPHHSFSLFPLRTCFQSTVLSAALGKNCYSKPPYCPSFRFPVTFTKTTVLIDLNLPFALAVRFTFRNVWISWWLQRGQRVGFSIWSAPTAIY
jgi:hypothetical protein